MPAPRFIRSLLLLLSAWLGGICSAQAAQPSAVRAAAIAAPGSAVAAAVVDLLRQQGAQPPARASAKQ